MIANGGDAEGLFRGAFMNSGSVMSRGDISLGQRDYDDLVRATGCARTEDTLECLRQVPFPALKEAVNRSPGLLGSYRVRRDLLDLPSQVVDYTPQPLDFSWGPRADGTFLEAPFQQLVQEGSVAKIPFVTGNENVKFYVFPLISLPGYLR